MLYFMKLIAANGIIGFIHVFSIYLESQIPRERLDLVLIVTFFHLSATFWLMDRSLKKNWFNLFPGRKGRGLFW